MKFMQKRHVYLNRPAVSITVVRARTLMLGVTCCPFSFANILCENLLQVFFNRCVNIFWQPDDHAPGLLRCELSRRKTFPFEFCQTHVNVNINVASTQCSYCPLEQLMTSFEGVPEGHLAFPCLRTLFWRLIPMYLQKALMQPADSQSICMYGAFEGETRDAELLTPLPQWLFLVRTAYYREGNLKS
ncbi:hypothetical protein B0J14DRAFT_595820 [Halenospora varia]|nr:hypothetical protein B0J14DRAFT_595820 [Halenospora varia]